MIYINYYNLEKLDNFLDGMRNAGLYVYVPPPPPDPTPPPPPETFEFIGNTAKVDFSDIIKKEVTFIFASQESLISNADKQDFSNVVERAVTFVYTEQDSLVRNTTKIINDVRLKGR